MKKEILLLVLVLLRMQVVAQNEVHLKSGEILNCKVKSLANGDLTVIFKNNIMHFKVDDITSIFFSKQPAKSEVTKQIEKGELKGVVTYYAKESGSYKSDVGSDVIIFKTDWDDSLEQKIRLAIIKFSMAQWDRMILDSYPNIVDETTKKAIDGLKEMDAHTDEGYNRWSRETKKIIDDIQYHRENTIYTTVDGNGAYSVKLPPGGYGIIFISKNLNIRSMGRIDFSYAEVGANEAITKSQEFR